MKSGACQGDWIENSTVLHLSFSCWSSYNSGFLWALVIPFLLLIFVSRSKEFLRTTPCRSRPTWCSSFSPCVNIFRRRTPFISWGSSHRVTAPWTLNERLCRLDFPCESRRVFRSSSAWPGWLDYSIFLIVLFHESISLLSSIWAMQCSCWSSSVCSNGTSEIFFNNAHLIRPIFIRSIIR